MTRTITPNEVLAIAGALVIVAIAAAVSADLYSPNPLQRSVQFRRRRCYNWLSVGFVYAIYYMARYAVVASNSEAHREKLGLSLAEYGSILSAGFWAYAIATLHNGHLLDRIGGRKGLIIGVFGCAVSCGALALVLRSDEPSAVAFALCSTVNMSFNTFASLSVLRINVNWYEKVERGGFSASFGVMISFGYYLALALGGAISADYHASFVFLAPCVLLLTVGLPLCIFVVLDAPPAELVSDETHKQSGDLSAGSVAPTNGHAPLNGHSPRNGHSPHKGDSVVAVPSTGSTAHGQPAVAATHAVALVSADEPPLSYFSSAAHVLAQPKVLATFFGLVGTGWIREGWLSWYKSYMEETAGLEVGSVGLATAASILSLCGMVGSLAGGYISDRCCGAKRGPVALVYCTMQLVCLGFLFLARGNAVLTVLGSGFLGLFFFGSLTLLMGAAAADFVEPRYSGMASGLVNFGQYGGAGIAAVSTGAVVESFGWNGLLVMLFLGPLCSCAAMLWLMRMQANERKLAHGLVNSELQSHSVELQCKATAEV